MVPKVKKSTNANDVRHKRNHYSKLPVNLSFYRIEQIARLMKEEEKLRYHLWVYDGPRHLDEAKLFT